MPDAQVSEKELHALLVECPELRELERQLAGFNLFRVLRFESGELRHSNVLAWLLTPGESHGLRDHFFRRWLMRILHDGEIATDIPVAAVDASFIRSVQVSREWWGLDLLVQVRLDSEEWVIAIENKINAGQGTGQLARYRNRVESSFPNAKRVFIFLTMRNEDPDDDQWIAADYGQVAEILDECVEEHEETIGHEPRVLIEHYRRIIREVAMPDEKLIDLARSIYDRHQRALEFIFENRVDGLALLTEALTKRMKDASLALKLTPMNCHQGFVRFIPQTWDTAKNRAGNAWGDPSAFVLCEIALRNTQPALKIVECKADASWRTQLFDLARADKATFSVRSKMPEQWMTVYQHKMPKPSDDDEPEDMAEAIWKACAEHLAGARFKKAEDIIASHIQKLPA